MKMTPPLGAEVAVYFKGGDPDQPRYFAGHWGLPGGVSEMPTDSQTDSSTGTPAVVSPGDSPDIHCHEFKRYKIRVDERAGHPGDFSITDKISGDTIEFDGSGPGIYIKGTAAVVIQSDGLVAIDAIKCTINGREVSDGSQTI